MLGLRIARDTIGNRTLMRLSMSHEDGLEKTLLTSGPGEWGAEGYLGGWELAITTFEYRLSVSRCE